MASETRELLHFDATTESAVTAEVKLDAVPSFPQGTRGERGLAGPKVAPLDLTLTNS